MRFLFRKAASAAAVVVAAAAGAAAAAAEQENDDDDDPEAAAVSISAEHYFVPFPARFFHPGAVRLCRRVLLALVKAEQAALRIRLRYFMPAAPGRLQPKECIYV